MAVVGLGALGSAALWRLARRGTAVAGVERHGLGHDLGSSHGTTRLFRIACHEHPELPAFAQRTLELWRELGAKAGEVLVRRTGCLTTGAPDSRPVTGALTAAAAAGVPVEVLDHAALVERQPQYAGLAPDDIAVWDPGAGLGYPERVVRAQTAAARRLGAEVYTHTAVQSVEPDASGVTVRAPGLELRADRAIVAAGAWLGTLVPGLPLAVRSTAQHWLRPAHDDAGGAGDFALERFPVFVWRRPNGDGLWGHGATEGHGVKIGVTPAGAGPGTVVPGTAIPGAAGLPPLPPLPPLPRAATDGPAGAGAPAGAGGPAGAAEDIGARIADAFPGLDPQPTRTEPCLVTDTPDDQFLVGRVPGRPRLLVAGGDNGHAFKHAAAIGDLLAHLTTDDPPPLPTAFLDPGRFA